MALGSSPYEPLAITWGGRDERFPPSYHVVLPLPKDKSHKRHPLPLEADKRAPKISIVVVECPRASVMTYDLITGTVQSYPPVPQRLDVVFTGTFHTHRFEVPVRSLKHVCGIGEIRFRKYVARQELPSLLRWNVSPAYSLQR
jgi:hypothetical protein